MTTNRQHPNAELERVMMADYIAQLEKRLDAAEIRAGEAEAGAQDARHALAASLLEKARDQKSEKGRAGQGLLRHDIQLDEVREEVARKLRVEYEQKLNAVREQMTQEFQERLANAQKMPAVAARSRPGAVPTAIVDSPAAAKRRPVFAMVAAAFAGGFALGWSALPDGSAKVAEESIALPVAERLPEETAAPRSELPPAAAAPVPLDPPPSEEGITAAAKIEPAAVESTVPTYSDTFHLSEEYRATLERNASLAQQLDALQIRLERAIKRAGAAESALRAEREKSAEPSRRAGAGNSRQTDQSPSAEPLAQQPDAVGRDPDRLTQPLRAIPHFPTVE